MSPDASAPLVGREPEVAALERFTQALAGGVPRAVFLRGDPGIGKTALWRAGIAAAEAAGVRTLTTCCVEAEMPIAACALADLFENALGEVAGDLPAPQRAALEGAVGLEPAQDLTLDRVTLPRAVYAMLRLLSERGPVLVAIDDGQWLDPASRRLLAFALRRLSDKPVGVLAAIRAQAPQPDPLGLERANGQTGTLDVGPLSRSALRELLRSRLGVRLARPSLTRVHNASRGNPLYALEFARGLDDAATSSLAHMSLPASLDDLVRARLERLDPALAALLEPLAVLDRPTVALARRLLGGADADGLVDAASSAGVLVVAPDDSIAFSHPLLAAAVYGRLAPGRRRALHARVADVVDDDEERARHRALAAAGPDADVADALEAAARKAASRGAIDAAVALAAGACRLTPPGDDDVAARRALAEAQLLTEAGELGRARAVADALLATAVGGPLRARALHLRYVLAPPPRFGEAIALLVAALEHTGEDRGLHVRLLAWLAHAHGFGGDYREAEWLAQEAVEHARSLGDPTVAAIAATCLFDVGRVRGTPQPAAIVRAMSAERVSELAGELVPDVVLGRARCAAGEVAAAREQLARGVLAAEARGDEFLHAVALFDLADAEWQAGEWNAAEAHVENALEVFVDGEYELGEAEVRSRQALFAAHRGDAPAARAHAAAATARAQAWGWDELAGRCRWALGFLELSLGEPRAAWSELEPLPALLDRIGIGQPGVLPAIPDVIETLVALGRSADAEPLLDAFERRAAALGHRWAMPAALRCRALLALAGDDGDAALDAGQQAVDLFAASGHRFDRARALLVCGDALRRLGRRRRAAEKLEAARTEFAALGAPLWLDRAARELRRAAPRPRQDDTLTAAERRVAELVVTGRTNREVAAELFTTVSTVEAHLTRIYRKLGVRSRTELAGRARDLGTS